MTLSHGIENCDSQGSHLQLSSELPDPHEESVIRDRLGPILVVHLTSVNKVLETAKGTGIRVWEPDDMLDFINLAARGKFLAVVRTLGAKKILLDAKRNLIWSDQDDDKDRMRIAISS
jgi:hypothetical protein